MNKESKIHNYSAKSEVGFVRTRRTRFQRIILELRKAPPTAIIGLFIIILYIILALFAAQIAPYGEAEIFPIP